MKANAITFLNIFEKKLRLEVPLFQRQYVWSLEHQWEPLWEDIALKFAECLKTQDDAPPHFLGAMVLDQKQTPTTHVEKRQVIDGQQRLITMQIFLSSFRDFCREQKCDELADECDSFILNKGMMADPKLEKFKVWPTQLDRDQFADVVTLGSREAIETKHPLTYRKYSHQPESRPRMIHAYLFFYEQISNFFLGSESDKPFAEDRPLESRLDKCLQALKNAIKVVVIDLEPDDDAQVIFETLNARGEPLLPADLLRNYIFLRATRQGENVDELYNQYWRKFDDEFWRKEIRQGRLRRPRSDLFMQHFLTSRKMTDTPIKYLFTEYKSWIQKDQPFKTIRDELEALARQGDDFRRLLEPRSDDSLYQLATFLNCFDMSTTYPLLLFLLDAKVSDAELRTISIVLESYLLRRAVCSLTTKGYNRIFLNLTHFLKQNGPTSENLRRYLSGLSGESIEWPKDEVFFNAWHNDLSYALRSSARVYILRYLNDSYLSSKTERISIESKLTLEHILPQNWLENWLLPDGSKGMTSHEIHESEEENLIAKATSRRNSMLQTFGNLTILTQPLNSAVSNSAWKEKKPQLLQSSLLPINQQLVSYETWDEEAIERRGKELFERAKLIWPAPPRNPERYD